MNLKQLLLLPFISLFAACQMLAGPAPADFPSFTVPGHEKEMASLRTLFWLHYEPAGPLLPLWEEWMTMSTLWPGRGEASPATAMRERWRSALASRIINSEGYVHTQQHDGLGHAEGWPFPLWTQAGGMGWHFRGTGIQGYDGPLVQPDKWKLIGATNSGVNDKGWVINLESPDASAQTPAFSVPSKATPWLRMNWWATGLENADCWIEWTTSDKSQFSPERRAYFTATRTKDSETRTMIPMFRVPGWTGTITGLRVHFGNSGKGVVTIKSFHTACDTRHTINNCNFIRGCHEYFLWTHDFSFLREELARMRLALRYMMSEFQTRERKCVYVTWPGHEGRSGIRIHADGRKEILRNEGIGGNYWDLLPFGGEDALSTLYYYDAVLRMAAIEEAIKKQPEWTMPGSPDAFDTADLRKHAAEVREYSTNRFWNPATRRYGTVDLEGVMHDYGFTFLNNEAIYYDFATAGQAREIRDWISGRRTVQGDTSTGSDIYHWRFGPRSTTRRNIEYYFWAWENPESIPFGNQVQDGGGVLGFSYHDLMACLKVEGPNAAWKRLGEITTWFDEVQAAGGYRAYYKDPSRGTMQGGNVPGGLGLDKEFFESVLVPQVMIYGFMGIRPSHDGLEIHPKLPEAWPSFEISRIHFGDHMVDVRSKGKTVEVKSSVESFAALNPLKVKVPAGWNVTNASPASLKLTTQ